MSLSEEEEEERERLTEEQINTFRSHFETFDIKQEGAIQSSDLGTVLRACGQIPTEGWLKERMKVKPKLSYSCIIYCRIWFFSLIVFVHCLFSAVIDQAKAGAGVKF